MVRLASTTSLNTRMKLLPTLAKVLLLILPVIAEWSINWKNQAVATAGIIASCGGQSGGNSLANCLIGALASVLMAVAAGWKNGNGQGVTESHAKRDLALYDAIPHFEFDPLSIAQDAVYTRFPDNMWRMNVDPFHLNETVLEQVSSLGKTFVTKQDDTVRVSLRHPDEKLQQYEIDPETGLKKRVETHDFGDFVAHYKYTGQRHDVNMKQADAQSLARIFITTVTDGGSTPLNIQEYCVTVEDKKAKLGGDLSLAIEASDFQFTHYMPACGV
ncbi:hypothetical protein TRICI_005443 [Trichomonascus ciferrii]|uniref:Uncharacterized protein n=1 Tax=Trichomonascus ciferrii TaxID=44093 RepID=A0A642UUG4_9ASCO|nr:hypothetical protein TRICI_005443 [Trichomonascus ciferrii]